MELAAYPAGALAQDPAFGRAVETLVGAKGPLILRMAAPLPVMPTVAVTA